MKDFGFNAQELKILRKLDTPKKVQDFLNELKINFEERGETCMSPRRVLRKRKAHCMEGALLAGAAFQLHGRPPLVIDLRSVPSDDDHIVTVFRLGKYWGGLGKTNHAVLRYREPIYKSLRELVLSFFHEYIDKNGSKTLREYTQPINLSRFDKKGWHTAEEELFYIPQYIDEAKHLPMLNLSQIRRLRPADPIEQKAGELTEWKLAKGRTVRND